MMHLHAIMDLVELGSWVHEFDNKGLLPLQKAIANRTALHMEDVEADERAWTVLRSNDQYMRAVMRELSAKIRR